MIFKTALLLRTVPTIVSAHTYTSRARMVGIDVINYATKYFSYCDQIKFNEPVLKLGIPE